MEMNDLKKKLILYGSGIIGVRWLEHLGMENVFAFASSDINETGKCIKGKKVLSIDELKKIQDEIVIFISTSYKYKSEIFNVLMSNGLGKSVVGSPYIECENYIDWDTQIDVDSYLEGRNALLSGVKIDKCQLGYASYISRNSILSNTKIGRYSCIGPNARMIIGQHPTRKFVSIHPMFYSTQQTIQKTFVSNNLFEEFRHTKNGYSVEIGNDVWIGDGVSIMEGVSIADGTIIAANANVVKDTEPYALVGGNPAKTIRFRFGYKEIDFLMKLKWWNKDNDWIEKHAKYFNDIENFISVLEEKQEYV
jgi:acetyltransferase-like isoleucine patch superfamily enzyme